MTVLDNPQTPPAFAVVTSEQRKQYHEKGYLVLRNVFDTNEVSAWRAEAARLLASDYVNPNNLRTRPRPVDGKLVVERFDPVVDVSPLFASVAHDPRITETVYTLYGEAMVLFKDKLIFKLPGMSGYTMHQDWAFWQPFTPPVVSVMVAIDGADAANGTLEVFPGYQHRLLSTPGMPRNMNAEEVIQIDPSMGELLETQPGDVIFFDGLTPHQSGPNTSDRSRQQLYLSYSAARHGDQYIAQAEHYRTYNEAKMSDEDKQRLFFR